MERPLIGLLATIFAAQAAAATPVQLVLDGRVRATYGNGPSLQALDLEPGDFLHYEVLVRRDGEGFIRYADGSTSPQPDSWSSPTENNDNFYAEMLVEAYEPTGSYYGWDREFFVGSDIASEAYVDCDVLGRLFVGLDSFNITRCEPVAEWNQGDYTVSVHGWHDPDTGEYQSVWADLRISQVIPVPEPGSAALLTLGLVGLRGAASAGRARMASRQR